MNLPLTARRAEKLLTLMNVLLESPVVDPDIVAIAKHLEQEIAAQNALTAAIADQYRQVQVDTSFQAPLFPRAKDLPKA